MYLTNKEKELIKIALEERYKTLFQAVYHLAKERIVKGETIRNIKEDLNIMQGTIRKLGQEKTKSK